MNRQERSAIIEEMIAEGKTYNEIGKSLGVSCQRVGQLTPSNRYAQRVRGVRKLLAIYRWMEGYHREHGYHSVIRDLVDAGFSPSTSAIRYLQAKMIELGMMERDPGIPRGIRLLPLKKAAPIVQEVIHKEVEPG